MGQLSPVLAVGVAQVVAAAVIPAGMLWLAMHAGRIGAAVGAGTVRLLRRCRLLRAGEVRPAGPPVQRIAADLRRLAAAVRELPRGTSRARQQGMLRAYDEVLVSGCAALDVPQVLGTLPPGLDRDLERLRVEAALRAAGLAIDPAPRHQDLP